MLENTKSKLKRPFYFSTGVIIALSLFGFLYGIPLFVAVLLWWGQNNFDKKYINNLKTELKKELEVECSEMIDAAHKEAKDIKAKAELDSIKAKNKAEYEMKSLTDATQKILIQKNEARDLAEELMVKVESLQKTKNNLVTKISKLKHSHKAIKYSIDFYHEYGDYQELDSETLELLYPSVTLPLHSYDVKVLKKEVNQIQKDIKHLLISYEGRYKTKANKSIYSLMVIALQAELQNVLYNLRIDKIENTKTSIKEISLKYFDIAGKGNQSIYSTIVRFIGEIESLFLNLADTEYTYYVKREQEKEEQRVLRDQMRQESEERKLLEAERKKIEAEEKKYHTEIDSLQDQLNDEKDEEKLSLLEAKIKELQGLLSNVEDKKEEIVNLQNGKAGKVYIISNIGSFGENIFKVGMTRRIEAMDRIKELSSASVPFAFDVHSFIFSEDAPALENKLHKALNHNRVNRVNLRKEFFNTSIDEMEKLVTDLDPTAEFKRTLISHEYQQTLEILSQETA
jgi:hypothetical protein